MLECESCLLSYKIFFKIIITHFIMDFFHTESFILSKFSHTHLCPSSVFQTNEKSHGFPALQTPTATGRYNCSLASLTFLYNSSTIVWGQHLFIYHARIALGGLLQTADAPCLLKPLRLLGNLAMRQWLTTQDASSPQSHSAYVISLTLRSCSLILKILQFAFLLSLFSVGTTKSAIEASHFSSPCAELS